MEFRLLRNLTLKWLFQVADTQRHADLAANLAVIDYEKENLEPPILSVEEAVERGSFFQVPPFLCPEQVGDFSKGIAEADHQILSAEVTSILVSIYTSSTP